MDNVKFVDKWMRGEKEGFTDKIRRKVRPPPPLKPKIEQAQKNLQIQIARLDAVHDQLRRKDEALFRRIIRAMQEREVQYASVLSNELVHIRKIRNTVNHAKLALEQINLRLGTITELGDVVVTLNPAMAVIKNVRAGLNGMMPEVDNEMNEVNNLLSNILVESSQVPSSSLPMNISNDNEVQAILEEATSIIENSVKTKIPDLPFTIQEKKSTENVGELI